jgi:hypothetical protein
LRCFLVFYCTISSRLVLNNKSVLLSVLSDEMPKPSMIKGVSRSSPIHGKDGVISSNLISGSISHDVRGFFVMFYKLILSTRNGIVKVTGEHHVQILHQGRMFKRDRI